MAAVLAASAFGLTHAQEASRLDQGRAFHQAGAWSEALAAYADVARALSESDPASAATARNNACVIRMNLGEHRQALEECREALRLRQRVADPLRLGRTLNNLGLALQYLGQYAEATARFDEARDINRGIGDAQGEMINTTNLATTAIQAGRYSAAIDHLTEALELADRNPGASWAPEQVRLARINQGVVYERLGAFRSALETYKAVLAEGDALREHQRASLLLNLGVVYRNLGDPVAAIEAFEEAVAVYSRIGDRAALSNAHLNIGLVRQNNLEEPRAAERSFRLALKLARAAGDSAEEAQDLVYLGHLLVQLGRLDEAEAHFDEVLAGANAGGTRVGRWLALQGLAEVLRGRGDLRGAMAQLMRALDEIEEVRASLDVASLRSDYFADKRTVYAATVDTLAELDRLEPGGPHAEQALTVVQRAKARSLLDALGSGMRLTVPLAAAEIAIRVGDGLLLDFFVGDAGIYAWVVHGGAVRMIDLGEPGPILRRVARVHASLSRREPPDDEAVRWLSEILLAPVVDELSDAGTLRIAPSRGLHYLPFEILRVPGRDGARLIEVTTVSYLPSGSALAAELPRDGDYPLTLLAFGNPLLPSPDDEGRLTPASLVIRRFGLGPLPAAADELRSLEKWLPGEHDVRIGEGATEEAFGEMTQRGAHVVHLGSHTVVDEAPGRGAAILLSPGAASDGLLTPQEVAALDYRADLTVLAACRTSLGSAAGGDALASLTGAFLAAGSRAVVATLWDVEDEATRVFMDQFYYELGRGLSTPEALRRAKLRLISDPTWRDSGVWAAFIVVGETGAVVGRRASAVVWWLSAVLVAGLVYWLISRRRESIPGRSTSA